MNFLHLAATIAALIAAFILGCAVGVLAAHSADLQRENDEMRRWLTGQQRNDEIDDLWRSWNAED